MKYLLLAIAMLSVPAMAADVGVSVSIGQPGFYGRIDIGDFPAPRLIYRQPVVIERVARDRSPIYLHVPPGHAKDWRRHCHAYNACGERVYFVQRSWYDREYVPRFRERDSGFREERRDERRDDRRHDRRRDHGDRRDDHGRGHR